MNKNFFKLALYYFPECPYCALVLNAISSLDIQQFVKLCNIRLDPAFQTKLINDTGRKTVPCLYINDKPMHESKDIIAWLKAHAQDLTKDS